MENMKLCILMNDELPHELVVSHTSYAAVFEQLLRKAGFNDAIKAFRAHAAEYPADWDDFDAVLLTGSRASAFSSESWVVALREQVHKLLRHRIPMIGVCFGHQLIALCLGARVARSPNGWERGRLTYEWLGGSAFPGESPPSRLALLASHQDQVLGLPPGATLLARSSQCPVAAFSVDGSVLCVQPHPEFDAAMSTHFLDLRRAQMGDEIYHDRISSLQHGHDGAWIGRYMVRFLREVKIATSDRECARTAQMTR